MNDRVKNNCEMKTVSYVKGPENRQELVEERTKEDCSKRKVLSETETRKEYFAAYCPC